ncbi:MAG TPA: AraC family transcriptional regulator, partial [Firmicutes bacterium]|nr:AraC family transcriptional regulator [Bacillota bacterium]
MIDFDMSITKLCDIIGHSSLSHFSSVFKKTYGMAPGKYRESYKT